MRLLLYFIFGVCLFSLEAEATVLMLDFNYSKKEVETARAAAKARGEAFQVIPDLTDDQRSEIDRLKSKFTKLDTKAKDQQLASDMLIATDPQFVKIESAIGAMGFPNRNDPVAFEAYQKKEKEVKLEMDKRTEEIQKSPAYLALHAQADLNAKLATDAEKAFTDKLKTIPQVTSSALESALRSQNEKNQKVTSLVLSGHHVVEKFYGDHQSGIHSDELFDMLRSKPELTSSLTSVYLWGCNTINNSEIKNWKSSLPNLHVMAGWDGSGPKDDKDIDSEFLKTMMINEKALSARADAVKLSNLFNSVKGIAKSNAAICVGNTLYTNKEHKVLDFVNCTQTEKDETNLAISEFKKYLAASEHGYENVPTDGIGSALRRGYTNIQQDAHCAELAPARASLASIIRLINFPNLTSNFEIFYKEELKALNAFLDSHDAPSELRLKGLSSLSRQTLLARLTAISNFVNKAGGDASVGSVLTSAARMLGDCKCTDEHWMDPQTDKESLPAPDENCIHAAP